MEVGLRVHSRRQVARLVMLGRLLMLGTLLCRRVPHHFSLLLSALLRSNLAQGGLLSCVQCMPCKGEDAGGVR